MIYCYICPKCEYKKEVYISIKEMESTTFFCQICKTPMNRDYNKEHQGMPIFILRGFGWSEDGYSHDIDQAEIEMKKRGLPVAKYPTKRWNPERDQYYPGKEI